MKLLIQPEDGIGPVIKGIERAKKSIDIVIFRFDKREIEKALRNAVERGVHVHALIAYTNRGGEKNLRQLEMRLLAAGVTVARSADDLARYHGKMMIVDRNELYLLAFNFTTLDMENSRSFGVITKNRKLVQESLKLFEADTKRQPYDPGLAAFVVSPVNARKQLASFIKGAKRELLIYDVEISDPEMTRLLEDRRKAGVEIRIIGRLARRSALLTAKKSQRRLHTRTIIRDGKQAFIGSQSLRAIELNSRREIGVIFSDRSTVSRLTNVFEADWSASGQSAAVDVKEEASSPRKVAKKVAEAVANDLPPIADVLNGAVKAPGLDNVRIEETVRNAVKEAVKQVVKEVVGAAK